MPYKNKADRRAWCKRNYKRIRPVCLVAQARYRKRNRAKLLKDHAQYREINRLKINRASLKYRLQRDGMPSRELVRALTALDNFNGICQCCGKKCSTKWCVDHCHRTKKFRGIIGHSCNVALGFVRDDIKVLRKLAKYLGKKL